MTTIGEQAEWELNQLYIFINKKARETWQNNLIRMFNHYGEPVYFDWKTVRSIGKNIYEGHARLQAITIFDEASRKRTNTHKKKTIKTEAKKILTSPVSKSFVSKNKQRNGRSVRKSF